MRSPIVWTFSAVIFSAGFAVSAITAGAVCACPLACGCGFGLLACVGGCLLAVGVGGFHCVLSFALYLFDNGGRGVVVGYYITAGGVLSIGFLKNF